MKKVNPVFIICTVFRLYRDFCQDDFTKMIAIVVDKYDKHKDNRKMNKLRIQRFAGQTLVGSFGEFPRDGGNCFSVVANDGIEYFIVNCFAENAEEWISRNCSKGGMQLCEPDAEKYPEIEAIPCDSDQKFAKIVDKRIPESWLRKTYCEGCVPSELLPEEQRKKAQARHDLAVKEGRVSIITLKNPDGTEKSYQMTHENISVTPKKLKTNWTIEEGEDIGLKGIASTGEGFVYAPYIPKTKIQLYTDELKNE